LVGLVLAEAGIALVGCGEWDALKIWTRVLLYAGGFLLCTGGMFLIWKEPFGATLRDNDEALDGITLPHKEGFLGRINLNGHFFEAYEEEAEYGGRRFRLRSFPPLCPDREAGFIRYLIHEGFIEKRWPRLSRKIEEEASWAFFF
jgi:hypothetical protein